MKKRVEVEKITGLSRRQIQELEAKIIVKRPINNGETYKYNDEEIKTLLLAKFLKECDFKNKEIKDLLDEYSDNKDVIIRQAILAMQLKTKKLENSINLANNMLNSELTLWDISSIYDKNSSLEYDELVTLFNYVSSIMTQDVLSNLNKEFERTGIIEEYVDYIDECQDSFNNKNLDMIFFQSNIEKFIINISKSLGIFSSTFILQVLSGDFLLEYYDEKYVNLLKEVVNNYLNENILETYEYKVKCAFEKIFEYISTNSHDNQLVQNEINVIYELGMKLNRFGLDSLDDIEFRGNILDSIIVKKYLDTDEQLIVSKVAKAFKYFVEQKRKIS